MPQDQVEEVKQKIDIVSLISEFVDLKKAGRNYRALCPFHSEKTPSFMVSPELQIFKCFGCGESGDAISFLQKYEGMDFAEALRFLAERAGVKLERLKPGLKNEKEKLFQINDLAARFYQYLLLGHSVGRPALTYLEKARGLKPDTLKKFKLGFSPDKPGALKSFLVDKKKIQAKDVEKAGIAYLRQGQLVDRFKGRVVFPLFDHRGNTVGFAGRILPSKEKSGLAKYINSPETLIYKKANVLYGLDQTRGEVKEKGEAVVVEGELDLLSSWQAQVKNVVAIKGSALTEDQARLLSRFSKRLIFALDSDLAGDAAARRGVVVAQDQGLEIKVARLGSYKDPDEMARKVPDKYKKALSSAQGVWDFMVDSIFSKHEEKEGEGKMRISKEAVPVLASISDKIVQAHYVQVVAERLGVSVAAVAEQVSSTLSERPLAEPEASPIGKTQKKERRELLEERLMTLAFQSDAKILKGREVSSLISTPLAKRILDEYKSFSKTDGEFNPSAFAEHLSKELVEGFAEMVLKDTQGLSENKEQLARETALIIRELKILEVKKRLSEVAKKIRGFEEKGEARSLRSAQKEFTKLTRALSNLKKEWEPLRLSV